MDIILIVYVCVGFPGEIFEHFLDNNFVDKASKFRALWNNFVNSFLITL